MDLIVIAGTHMAACSGLRRQILDSSEALAAQGIHVPSTLDDDARTWHNYAWEIDDDARFDATRGTMGVAVEQARRAGSRALLLMSEEYESAAINPSAVQRLVSAAEQMNGTVTAILAFRHQLSYLNLVFAFRAVNGGHGNWFEDFVREPVPPRQFDYVDVIERFDRHASVRTVPMALDDVVAGGGLGRLLQEAGVADSLAVTIPLEVETAPPTMRVLASLMAYRLLIRRKPEAGRAELRRTAREVGKAVAGRFSDAGPYWGWTPALIEERIGIYTAANEQLADRYGVVLTPDDAPEAETDPHLRNASRLAIKALFDELNGATRPPGRDPAAAGT